MAAPIASTTMSSRRVNPLSRFTARGSNGRSIGDVAVLALAAFLAVGAQRDEVVRLALSRHREAVIVAPRVLEVRLLRIRPIPLVAARIADERAEIVGILADLQLVHLDLAGELLDADARLLRLGAAHLLEDLGTDEGHDPREPYVDVHDH